ncbi:Lrp/AsnC family transcriptional regulator [Nocardioides sp. SYSU DS0663]|uniref:Lrp/AsnC family transcriptional regulator n=1 Tax=Nocardioides sp. SYSU DS0663 TaxID=3416445 RepID=UPI003F4C22BC
MQLDDVDLALLEALRADGRVSYEGLGTLVGLSRTAARARVQRMLELGIVRVEAIVHPVVRGYTTFAHLSVHTDGACVQTLAARIASFDNAPFVSVVAGRPSLIAEVRTGDLGEMETAIASVRDLDGVVGVDTLLYTDVVKDSHLPLGGPHAFEEFDLDAVDLKLLDLLRQDARTPYADLAEGVGLSRAATRARMLRLLADNVVVVKGLVSPTAVGIDQMCGFQVQLERRGDDVAEIVAKLETVDFMARTIGRCDLVGTMISRSAAEISGALDGIRMLDGVRSVEAWWHLALVKERYSPPLTRA